MRWLGLVVVLVAGFLLAWDTFGLPAQQPGPAATVGVNDGRETVRLISGIGITSGLLLIIIGARKFDRRETRAF